VAKGVSSRDLVFRGGNPWAHHPGLLALCERQELVARGGTRRRIEDGQYRWRGDLGSRDPHGRVPKAGLMESLGLGVWSVYRQIQSTPLSMGDPESHQYSKHTAVGYKCAPEFPLAPAS